MNTLLLDLAGLLIIVIASGRPVREFDDAYDMDDIRAAVRDFGYGWALITAACAAVVVSLIVTAWGLWATAQALKVLAIVTIAFAWRIDRLTLPQRDTTPAEITAAP
ncbi:hypothetical protein ACQP10_38065 (plasmid) [Streptosporangium sandarakinum]|uniref:hypothetical protein n=1 Tax=Streptosporangium sandarakinum TaxID=1260955 RepID=UPI003D8D8075